MKKFILHIILFFAVAVAVDRAFGLVLDHMNAHLKGGENQLHYDTFCHAEADVLIFGSSRANHHYVPSVVADSLHLSCRNCGYDALGVLNMYGRYRMMASRRKPKVVIYDVFPDNDIYGSSADHLRFLDGLKCHVGKPVIDSILFNVAPMERWKLLSHIYRYNTTVFRLVNDYFFSAPIGEQGYLPLYGTMDYQPKNYAPRFVGQEPDIVKLAYLEKLVHAAQADGAFVALVASPYYGATSDADFQVARQLCHRLDVPFLNHCTDTAFTRRREWYKDSSHLNHEGARRFTSVIMEEVKRLQTIPSGL